MEEKRGKDEETNRIRERGGVLSRPYNQYHCCKYVDKNVIVLGGHMENWSMKRKRRKGGQKKSQTAGNPGVVCR